MLDARVDPHLFAQTPLTQSHLGDVLPCHSKGFLADICLLANRSIFIVTLAVMPV